LDLYKQKLTILREAVVLKKYASELTRVNAELKKSEEKYRTMLNASPDGIILIDVKGVIKEVSEIGLQLFGSETPDEMIGRKISHFVRSEENKAIREMIEKTMQDGLIQNIEVSIKKKNQTLFPGELSSTLIHGPGGATPSLMIIVRDISQRKKNESKQLHADRMVTLGEMASGIAHEINQPLNIISMVLDKILFETARNEKIDIGFLKEKSDKIFENIIRIRNIIDHIRAFSRSHDDYVLAAFNINSSIENAVSMIAQQYKHMGISLDLSLDDGIPQIIGNTYKFEQVIVNLLANAKDAVVEKKAKYQEYTQMNVGIKTYQKNQSIIVEVNDNGIGINENDLNNVMLPFYTTKEEGKGTGLGLSICYQIIKEMGGTIEIISNTGSGTNIKLDLEIQKRN
jgi:PAS domain S-box-containing protein